MLELSGSGAYIYHLSLLVSLGAVTLLLPEQRVSHRLHGLLHGLIFGGVAVVGMLYPAGTSLPGLFFDGRSVVISLCSLFFGPLAGGVAAGIAGVCRVLQGGPGAPTGLTVILSALLLGLWFRRLYPPHRVRWNAWGFLGLGVLVHAVMLLAMLLLLHRMTWPEVMDVIAEILLPVMGLYPLATMLLGTVLYNQVQREKLLTSTRQSEARMREFMTHAPVALALSDAAGQIKFINRSHRDLFGFSPEDIPTVQDWFLRAYPDPQYRQTLLEDWKTHLPMNASEDQWVRPRGFRVTTKAGKEVVVEISDIALGDDLLVVFNDVTARKHAEQEMLRLQRLHAMLSHTNKLITRTDVLPGLLAGVCEIAVNHGGFLFAWVGELRPDGSIACVGRAGEDHGYIDALHLSNVSDDPEGGGPTGRSLRLGSPIIANDFRAASFTGPWHEAAARVGVTSSGAFPIRQQGEIYGALNLYAAEPNFFGAEEIATLEDLALDISHALDNLRREAERAEAVQAVQTLSERLSHFLSVSPIISYQLRMTDAGMRTEWVSENIESLLGFSSAEAMAPGWWEGQVHPGDRAETQALLNHLPGSGRFRHEYRILRKDGTVQWVLNSVTTSPIQEDGSIQIFGALTDLTERKQQEDHLRLLSAALNAAANGIVVTNADGRIVWVNPAFTTVTHYTYAEALGKYPGELLKSGQHDESFYRTLWETILDGRIWRGTITNRRKDGSLYMEELAITPIRDVAGRITHFVGIKEEVTERVRKDNALRESQERLQRALAIGNIALWEWDLSQRTVYYSPEWTRHVQDPGFGQIGRIEEWLERVHPDDLPVLQRDLETGGSLDADSWNRRFRLRDAKGEYRWILMNAWCLRDAAGTPLRVLGTNVDITDRMRLEHEFEQAQKLESIGRLAGGVAHDFNNLLSVIGGYTEMALESIQEGSELHEDLEQIKRAVERAANLTRQLLAFSRRQLLSPVSLNVNEVITESEKMLRRLIGENMELRLELGDQPGAVLADPGQIAQVLMNLVINSRDAMPDGGAITITTGREVLAEPLEDQRFAAQPGPYVRIAIADTGCGMSEAVREKLFEPFFTTKDKSKGTGLGLAVVFGIVKQSEGWMRVLSEPGRGTTVEVYLPEMLPAEATEAVPAAPRAQPRGHETILLVEDENELRNLVQRRLERAGFRVLWAADASEACAVHAGEPGVIDLLLTDVIMPGMSGPNLAEELLSRQPGLKVLFMSGYTDDLLAHHGVLNSGVELLSKPFSAAQLVTKVREVLDAPGLRQA